MVPWHQITLVHDAAALDGLVVRTCVDAQGDVLIEQVLVPKFDDPGQCECPSGVQIAVLPTEIRQQGT